MKAPTGLLAVLLMLSGTSFAQTAPTQPAAPTQQTAPAQAADGGDSAKPEAASQSSTASPAPTTSTPSTEASAAPAAPGFAIAPGAKIFVDPMNGFGEILSDAIVQKKIPVVIVKDPVNADVIVSGSARVRKRGFLAGMVLSTDGGANISMKDARTGNLVFACNFKRVDAMEREGDIYVGWAGQCALHLKQAMKKEEKRKASLLPH